MLYASYICQRATDIMSRIISDWRYWRRRAGVRGALPCQSGIWLWMKNGWGQASGLGQCFVFPSVLWHCSLRGRKDIRPVETTFCYSPAVLERGAGGSEGEPADAGSLGCWMDVVVVVVSNDWVMSWICVFHVCYWVVTDYVYIGTFSGAMSNIGWLSLLMQSANYSQWWVSNSDSETEAVSLTTN